MSQPAVYRGFGLGEFRTAHPYITQFLTKTFPHPLLAPSQVLGLRDALARLSDLIWHLLREGSDPTSHILRCDIQHQTNVLLKVVGAGLVDTLEALSRLVEIQAGADDGSELKWHNWVAALRMAGLLDGGNGDREEDWDGEGLVAVRRRLEETVWRIEYLFKVLVRSNIERIYSRLAAITDTLNAVLLNHQWLYFPSSIDDPNFDAASVRTTTPSVFSILRAKFGNWGSPRSDAVSEYSVETSTTTRERICRNQDALEIDTMIQKFQETAAGTKAVGYTAAIPDPAELAWRTKADKALIVLMHWVYRAKIGLDPFLNYHSCFPQQARKAQWLNELPVPGYVNLIKSTWILTTLDLKRGDLGKDLGDEGKALFGSLACQVIDLFQAISESEYDLPSAEATLAQGNFNINLEISSAGQRTPTLSFPARGLAEEIGFTANSTPPHCAFTVDTNPSSGSSSGASGGASIISTGTWEPSSKRRGRSAEPKAVSEFDSRTARNRPRSAGRGSLASELAEGCGRPRGHWRSFSSSITGSGDREKRPTSLNLNLPVADKSSQEQQNPGPGLRRPSTAASTSSGRTATNSVSNSYSNAFARVFAPFSGSVSSGRGSFSLSRPRSRSASPSPPQGRQAQRQSASQQLQGTSSQTNSNSGNTSPEIAGSSSPTTSTRSHRFSKLQFPTSKDRGRSTYVASSSLISLGSSVIEALTDKTRGVYPTKPLPPVDPVPPQFSGNGTWGNVPGAQMSGNGKIRATEGRGSVSGSVYGWSETSWVNPASITPIKAREGETEVMPKEIGEMKVWASYAGEIHGVRWDDCRMRIFTKPERGPNGEYGTKLRIVTQNMRMEGSIDQRTLFIEHCELIPEYAFHDQELPIIYIRKIASTRSKRVSNPMSNTSTVAGNNVTVVRTTATQWDDNSLYYRFSNLDDMFNLQLAMLGEVVEMDIRSIPTVRYKRRFFDGEHTHYRARAQIWRENTDTTLTTASELHAQNMSSAASRTLTNSFRDEGNSFTSPLTKIYSSRIVLYWENGGGAILFLTDSIELEVRNNNNRESISNNGSVTTLTPNSNGGDRTSAAQGFLNRRPSAVNTNNSNSNTLTDPPTGNFVLRIKPSTQFNKLTLHQGGSFKARLLSPGTTSASGFRLDKAGLRYEDCENGADGWDEYRWFEIEFQREVEMTSFMDDFHKWLNERRREKKKREEVMRVPSVVKNGMALGTRSMKSR